MIKIDDKIPVTLLFDYLQEQAGEPLTDAISGLGFLPENASPVLQEKAVAAIALKNNLNSFVSEPHAFANACLILNGVPAVVDYLPQVSTQYMNYAIWEMQQKNPDMALQPTVINYIKAAIEVEDFIIPPKYLQFIEYYFLDKYGEDAKSVDLFYDNYHKNPSALTDLELKSDFEKFHISKLLQTDSYFEKMMGVYKKYAEEILK